MKLADVKLMLGTPALDLSRQTDLDGNPTCWLRYWDNVKRIALVIGDDTLNLIKENPAREDLALKSEIRPGKDSTNKDGELVPAQPYTNHILIVSTSIETTI